jgi:hypothetical protein
MEQLVMRSRFFRLVGAAAFAAALAAPAAADPVYSWRTEDGGYAFTDDPKGIPPRYRDQAQKREMGRLHDYKHYTASDDAATERYAEQLTRRLEYLRSVNEERVAVNDERGPRDARPNTSISMQSANNFEPSVEFDQATGSEPIVVDTLFTRPEGKMVTRQTTVVRQGDRIVSIVRPRLREWNVNTDIHDESELPQ